jgi:hypothetical protein
VRQSMEKLKKQRFRGYPSCGKQGQQPPTVVEWFSFLLGSEGQCGCDSRSNRRALRIFTRFAHPPFTSTSIFTNAISPAFRKLACTIPLVYDSA